jgi:hypothetical protein
MAMIADFAYNLRNVRLGPWLWATVVACGLLLTISVVSLNHAASPQSYSCYDRYRANETDDCRCYPQGEEPAGSPTPSAYTFEGVQEGAKWLVAFVVVAGVAVAAVAFVAASVCSRKGWAKARPLDKVLYALLRLLGVAGVAITVVAVFMIFDYRFLGPCDPSPYG